MNEHTIIEENKWLTMVEDIWIHTIACCESKGALSKTCKYLHDFTSKNKGKILTHPSLVLSDKGLETFFLYYGALGNKTVVDNLLQKGANPNACDDKNMSLMHYAAQYGYIDIIKMLLQHPTLITSDIATGNQSPIGRAIHCNQSAVVKYIVSACSLPVGDILCYAAEKGSLNTVQTLLTCTSANSPNSHGYYPLHLAAIEGHTHIAKFLIANGALVDCCSTNKGNIGSIPLHFAASGGSTNMVQLLIEHGADVNLKEGRQGLAPLHVASEKGHVPVIEILLKNNAHINETTNIGWTPLHDASYNGHPQAIEILLKNNADVNAQGNLGSTPLDVSVRRYSICIKQIEKLLIAHGGKTSAELQQAELIADRCNH